MVPLARSQDSGEDSARSAAWLRGSMKTDSGCHANTLRSLTMSTAAQMIEPSATRSILGVPVAASSYEETIGNCLAWGSKRQSRALVFANVHVIMEAFDDPDLRSRLNQADMVNPDGVPLVWTLRALGESNAQRVYGPDAAMALLAAAEKAGLSVGFYGGTQSVLDALIDVVSERHPNLKIAF